MVWLAGQGVKEEARFTIVDQMFGKESYRQTFGTIYQLWMSLLNIFQKASTAENSMGKKKWAGLFGQDI